MINSLLNSRYQLKQLVGTGGMADVYLAYDMKLEREVAVKILHESLATNQTFIENFRREAKSAGRLVHPNIVGIYDVGEDQGHYYIVMEYVVGAHTVKDELDERLLSPKESVSIALDIAEGLKVAHAQGFVHCDIKPQNILISNNGHAKITDFGIARVTSCTSTLVFGAQEVMGTAHYLSPEQAQGKIIDFRSDLYSLGVVLYEMLTGNKAFDGENPVSIALKHVQEYPVPLALSHSGLPLKVCQIVDRLMEKDPDYRYSSTEDLIRDLTEAYYSLGGVAMQREMVKKSKPSVQEPIESSPKEVFVPPMSKFSKMSEERKVKKSYWIPALVLLFLFSFGGVFYFLSGPSIDEVSVPKVEGMTQEEAVKKLESLGLKVEISQSLDSKAELGKVIKQTPVENAKVKKGRTITLVVGGNSEKIKVPSLLGLSIKEAENALTKSNLALGNVVKGLDSTKPAGVILAQDTRAGDLVNKKSLIHVTINQEGSISMPDMRGKDQGDAVNILRNLGLDVTISEQSNSNQKNNSVISQTPDPATVMVNGGKVQLTVATTGKKQVSFSYEVQDEKEEIRFLKQTANGEQELFSKSVKKGEKIEKSFEIQRDEKVSFMVNGKLVSEK